MIFRFYSPSAFEKWDYKNPLGPGIGGSETAHVECALRLAKRGHKVISYSPLPGKPEKWQGVDWKDLKQADFKDEGIWVIGRWPQCFKEFKNKNKKQKVWLVMQDVDYPTLTKENSLYCDVYLTLCGQHTVYTKNSHPEIADRVVQSANGIRSDLISTLPKQKRDPFRLTYSSSPDRGLVHLLRFFPRLREISPKFNLHIFYGFDNIMKRADPDRTPIDDQYTTVNDMKLLMKQKGVVWHGRIGQGDLYLEYLKTGIWAYPTRFSETGCITSMEAQALGAIPVTNPFWALKDNIMYGTLIDGDPAVNKVTQRRYIDEIVYWAEHGEEFRDEMMRKARERFNWDLIVNQYEQLATT